MEIVGVIESPFMNLLVDSVVFAQMAEDVGKNQFHKTSRFTRASILNAILSVECAANCCIVHLKNGGSLRDDVDKMPFISKFEIFLGLTFNGTVLDRGRSEVQNVQELKAIRDKLVHPKRKTASINETGGNTFEGHWGEWERLKIKRLETSWNHEDAIKVLRAMLEFYNYYFLNLCKYNHNQVCKLLMHDYVTTPPSAPFKTQFNLKDANLQEAIKQWKLNFDFMGIHAE